VKRPEVLTGNLGPFLWFVKPQQGYRWGKSGKINLGDTQLEFYDAQHRDDFVKRVFNTAYITAAPKTATR
jgi:hypothetical protein